MITSSTVSVTVKVSVGQLCDGVMGTTSFVKLPFTVDKKDEL